MPREIPYGSGGVANSVLRHANDKLAVRVVIDHAAPIHNFGLMWNAKGSTFLEPSNTAGYGDGNGGTIRLRICPMKAGGTPDLANVVATETASAQTLWDRRGLYTATVTAQFMFHKPRTTLGGIWTHPADEAWWYVFDNVHADPGANWISFNGSDMRPSSVGNALALGPNGVNFPFVARPAGSYAVAGLDPREVVAWTTTGDNGTWQFGLSGGLMGQTRTAMPGSASTGYYDHPKIAAYGWTETSSGTPLFKLGNPYGYDFGITGTILRVDNVRQGKTVTHVGCFHHNPGTITFRNLTTGLNSTCSTWTLHNNGAIYRGALATAVVVNAGDEIELQSSNAVAAHTGDSSYVPFFDLGQGKSWAHHGTGTGIGGAPLLFADPWPDYEVAAAGDKTAPVVTISGTNGQLITAPTVYTATATDAVGVTKVDFYIDNVFHSTDSTSPYTTTVDPASASYVDEVKTISGTASGTFGLTFEGTTGAATLATTATAAQIDTYLEGFANIGAGGVVCTGGPLPTAVTVTFSGALVSKRNVGDLGVAGSTTGLSISDSTAGFGLGPAGSTHTLMARAVDAAGNSAESTRTFQALASTVDSTAPTVTINLGEGQVLPAGNTVLTATASDANGIKRVDFYVDGALHTTDTTSPYNVTINADAYTAGSTHTLLTRALDNANRLTVNQQGVETDTTGFMAGSNTTIARTTAQFRSGAAALRMTAVGTGVTSFSTPIGVSAMPVGPSVQYTADIWVRASATVPTFTGHIEWWDSGGTYISGSSSQMAAVTADTWTQWTITATSPANAAYASLTMLTNSIAAAKTWDVDDLAFASSSSVSRTFQAAGTPPSPTGDPCATVQADLVTMTNNYNTANALATATAAERDSVIIERDTALSQVAVLQAKLAGVTPPLQEQQSLYYTVLTSAGAQKYGYAVSVVCLLTLPPDEAQAVIAAGWITPYA